MLYRVHPAWVRFEPLLYCVYILVVYCIYNVDKIRSRTSFFCGSLSCWYFCTLLTYFFDFAKTHIQLRVSKHNVLIFIIHSFSKGQQPSTKHTHKTKGRVTRTPLKTGGGLWCSGRVGSSCSTSGKKRVSELTTDTSAMSRYLDTITCDVAIVVRTHVSCVNPKVRNNRH